MIELVERDLAGFFAAPFEAYGRDSPYVSPMMADLKRFLSAGENPLFASDDDFTFWTAMRDGRPLGRIVAHVHRASNARHGWNKAWFGFFDCANDREAARALLGAAESWAHARGFASLTGNFNLTAMQQAGIMTEGFGHPPYTDQIWGAPHLPALLEANGFCRTFPMTTFELDISAMDPRGLTDPRETEALQAGGFTFAPVTRATLASRLEDARTILNISFTDNPMFVPVSKEEFDFQARDMKWILDKRISAVMQKDGRAVGAVIAIPDLNPLLKAVGSKPGLTLPWHYLKYRLNRKRAVVIFQGVLPDYQGLGVNPLMLSHILREMRKAGYEQVGGTWIADENKASLRQAEKGGAKPLHRLHLFSKELA
ncbi:MAG: GNAT family N-acetyltransferase [Notoacmeibacter sp.]|nr:GNAT family N-acetyltransferase [Notoacmeibacter sp.]MCC0032299.1 GNAT family N-acetyltransferase [Brucellaceae bacterium]